MMKYAILFVLAAIIVVWYMTRSSCYEGFVNEIINPPATYPSAEAHGCAPPGVNASPGAPQYIQNADAQHVNPANKLGNPQNVFKQYKRQP